MGVQGAKKECELVGMALVVHSFCRTEKEKVCLSADQAFFDVIEHLHRNIHFVDTPYPYVHALGTLPAGFVNSRMVNTEELFEVCHQAARCEYPSCLAWAVRIRLVLSRFLDHVLWIDGYERTRTAMKRAACFAASTMVDLHCRRCRAQAQCRLGDLDFSAVQGDVAELVSQLKSQEIGASQDTDEKATSYDASAIPEDRLQLRIVNSVFVTWCVFSMGAFGIYRSLRS